MKSQVFTFIAAVVCSISGLAHVSAEITIEPDMEIQGGIRDVVSAVTLTVGPAEKEALERGLEQLLAAAADDREFLMLQVIYWAAHTQEPDIRDYVMPFSAYVFEQLHLSDEEILEMALPYLTDKTPYKAVWTAEVFADAIAGVISRNAPHPYAAALFVDWLLSDKVQKYIVKSGRAGVTIPHPFIPAHAKVITFGFADRATVDKLHAMWGKYVGRKKKKK